jgi:hypothetical protein
MYILYYHHSTRFSIQLSKSVYHAHSKFKIIKNSTQSARILKLPEH